MTILVGLVMICAGWSMISGSQEGHRHGHQPQAFEAWEQPGEEQHEAEQEDAPMEVEPEELQGVWADPGPPVNRPPAPARGRGRARGRARGRPMRARGRGPLQQAPFPQPPQQPEEPEEPINHPACRHDLRRDLTSLGG